jgi:hypothetical protein
MLPLLIILATLGLLFAVVWRIGSMQPRIATLERSVLINTGSERVFQEVSSLRQFVTWSPWSAKDPSMQQTFTGEDGSIGSIYSWQGNRKVGKGSMTVTAVDPGKRTELELDFGFSKAQVAFVVEPAGDQTKVTWKFESDFGGNPMMRLMQPAMKKFVGKDYAAGLDNLKKKLEA